MRSVISVAALLVAQSAFAVPLELVHQGRIMDQLGVPLDGNHTVDWALFDVASGGTALWSSETSETFDVGYFSSVLGRAGTPALTADLFDGDVLYLEIGIDDGAPLPQRVPIKSVPFAIRAQTAVDVRGGVVNATEIQIDGTTVIDNTGALVGGAADWANVTNRPTGLDDGDDDTLGALSSCGTNDLISWDGGAWTCAPTLDAAQLAGTIDIARLPVGTGVGTVAAGEHLHALSTMTGQLTDGQLPTNPTVTGDLTTGGALTSGADLASGGDLTAAGTLLIGGDGATCSAVGTLRWNATDARLEVCDGTDWLWYAPLGKVGDSPGNPGVSCKDVLANDPGAADGLYWIDAGGGFSLTQLYCDMTTDGGGWTLSLKLASSNVNQTNWFYWATNHTASTSLTSPVGAPSGQAEGLGMAARWSLWNGSGATEYRITPYNSSNGLILDMKGAVVDNSNMMYTYASGQPSPGTGYSNAYVAGTYVLIDAGLTSLTSGSSYQVYSTGYWSCNCTENYEIAGTWNTGWFMFGDSASSQPGPSTGPTLPTYTGFWVR